MDLHIPWHHEYFKVRLLHMTEPVEMKRSNRVPGNATESRLSEATTTAPQPFIAAPTLARRPYSTPQLKNLGEIRDLTMGGSPGVGDSGGAGTHRARRR